MKLNHGEFMFQSEFPWGVTFMNQILPVYQKEDKRISKCFSTEK